MLYRAQLDLARLRKIVEQEMQTALLTADALAALTGVGKMSRFIGYFHILLWTIYSRTFFQGQL